MNKFKIKNLKFKINQRGFTLIELMLYVGMLAIFIIVVSQFMYIFIRSQAKNQAIAEVEQQGAQIMNLITQTLRNADAVNSPAKGNNSATISIDVFDAGDDPTIFDLNSGAIRIKQGAGANINLSNSQVTASALDFDNVSKGKGPATIKIQFTLTHINPSNIYEYDYDKTFYDTASLKQ